MKEDKKRETEQYLADVIMERPYGFYVGDRHYCLWPVTLGKMYILQRHIDLLGIDREGLAKDISIEALRLAKEKRKECIDIIYVHTCRTKDEVFDSRQMADTTAFFQGEMTDEDIAALMITVLSSDKTEMFIKHLGIDREQKRLDAVMRAKQQSGRNSITIGGKSIYGSFIHPLLEVGMTWDDILWNRSYTNLRLLLYDKVNSIYVSDDERNAIPAWAMCDGVIKADDPNNREIIKSMSWK